MVVSPWTPALSGVSQGCVLFCLAIDSLSSVCPNSFAVKHADNVSFLHFIRYSSEDRLQHECNNITGKASSVQLPINYLKCKVLNIVTKEPFLITC